MGKSENYFIIPSLQLKKWISKNQIATKQGNSDCMNIFLYPNEELKTWQYKNKGKELDWTPFWNNFKDFS